MAAKLFKFTGQRVGDPDQGVVELVEQWLEKAKQGEVQAIAIIAIIEGCEILTERVENNHWGMLLAAHDVSRHSMLSEFAEK